MFNRLTLALVMLLVVMLAVCPVSAQDDDPSTLTGEFTFSSGVSFGYPDTWVLDEAAVSDFMVMLMAQEVPAAFLQVYDLPALYGDMPLELSFVQQTYGSNAASTWGFDFDLENFETVEVAGRELFVLAFEGEQNDALVVGYLVVVPYSDGGFGQITTYAVGEAPETYEQDVIAIAASFDVSGTVASAGGALGVNISEPDEGPDDLDTIDIEEVELTGEFTFPSGVSFGYPDTWVADESTVSDVTVSLTAQDVVAGFLLVYDLPALFSGIDLDLSMVQQMYGQGAADTWGFDFHAEDFKTVEIAGHELSVLAFEGEQDGIPVVGYCIVVTYSDGGFGQILTYAVGEFPATYEQDVIAIAASMDITVQ